MVQDTLSTSGPSFAAAQNPSDIASPDVLPSPDEDIGAVGPEGVVHGGRSPAPSNQYSALLEHTISQPFPLPSAPLQSLPTPEQEDRPEFSLSFAGNALPSTHVSIPTPPIVKAAQNLRLPSFELLGIAAPHPDRLPLRRNHSFSSLGAGPLSKPEDPLHALSPPLGRPHQLGGVGNPWESSPEAGRAHIDRFIPTVTPPTEPGTFNWGSFRNIKTAAGVGSPPSSEPGVSPSMTVVAGASYPVPSSANNAPTSTEICDAVGIVAWVEAMKELITADFEKLDLDSVKVLSHALPCPSLHGHLFGQVIAAIHEKTATPTAWINVFHAVPGRYTLSDLPKSPPSTPGQVIGGDEYFTSKVFDSAVAVPDYQLDSKLLPLSPRPVVAPGTVNVSIVERYIPPTNQNEFSEMFLLKGRSLLHDRLVELSPQNGLLLFVYPTRTGGRTFLREYLGPVLDPLLRSITVVHNLSSDLSQLVGHMAAVDYLREFEHLHGSVTRFCESLSTIQTGGCNQAKYSVIHASSEEMTLTRKTWANDWWIKQEKPRVREIVTKYFRKTKKHPSDPDITPTNLIQEILDGVEKRQYEDGHPSKGIEVGVFVIKKELEAGNKYKV